MAMLPDSRHPGGRLPAAFTMTGTSSFLDFLAAHDPSLLPGGRSLPTGEVTGAPHGTTIVALTFQGGIVMAGDRRATAGNVIASRHIEKVFPADDWSAIGIAGTAGLALELVRLFQLELEHHEKIEGTVLSLEGKANRLGTMVRGSLGLAMQGLAVLPLFGGYDLARDAGRIFSYDVTGGRYEEADFHAVGSGAVFARSSLKKLWWAGMSEEDAVRTALHALVDAADDDSATGGPDTVRRIWPVLATVTATGYRRVDDPTLAAMSTEVEGMRRATEGGGGDAR